MKQITTHEAKTHLSKYLAEVESTGAEIWIARGKRPVARLVPVELAADMPRPKVGEIEGEPFDFSDDVFKPLSAEELGEWGL